MVAHLMATLLSPPSLVYFTNKCTVHQTLPRLQRNYVFKLHGISMVPAHVTKATNFHQKYGDHSQISTLSCTSQLYTQGITMPKQPSTTLRQRYLNH